MTSPTAKEPQRTYGELPANGSVDADADADAKLRGSLVALHRAAQAAPGNWRNRQVPI